MTDEVRMRALAECAGTHARVQETADEAKAARSEHSNALKKWKAQGVNLPALKRAIRDRLLDPSEVLLEEHEYIRLRALQNFPTIQQDLMSMWTDVDIAEDQKQEIQRQRWRDDGAFSARAGHGRDTNPHPPGSEGHQVWDGGWLESPERIASEMAAGEQPESERQPARRRATETANGASRRRRVAAEAPAAA